MDPLVLIGFGVFAILGFVIGYFVIYPWITQRR
jgi:hypothetical protein